MQVTTSAEPSTSPTASSGEALTAWGGLACGKGYVVAEVQERYRIVADDVKHSAWMRGDGRLEVGDARKFKGVRGRVHVYKRGVVRGKPVLLHVGIEGA